ncbi:MAG: glycosyltransferase N-terminal domain-containing protein [Nitrospiraceae bacterium]
MQGWSCRPSPRRAGKRWSTGSPGLPNIGTRRSTFWVVEQALDQVLPEFLLVETELWLNILRAPRRRGIPSILVNGRLSTRSYERQRLPVIRDFYRTMLSMVDVHVSCNRS